ncbi:MAG: YihY/virulence factor BrkB family protein [Fibrobacter sp.]|nr:YihY/virulence factor BrkB family protein [Fibrobacter sp.]
MKQLRVVNRIIKHALKRVIEERVTEAAAAAAFFSFLSIFPLLILVISIGSYFMDSQEVMRQVLDSISNFVPRDAIGIIQANLVQVLAYRGGVSIFGIVGLLWSASGVFNTIQVNLSRAWPMDPVRNYLKGRLISILMVTSFFVLLLLFLIMQTVTGFIAGYIESILANPFPVKLLSRITLMVFTFWVFMALYRLVPKATIKWRDVFGGSVIATLLTGFLTIGFAWFLNSSLNRYNLVYGSLSALIAFMLWLYIMNIVILIGGHLNAAIAWQTRDQIKPI